MPIWIDAACINQSDDLEKSSQVSHMGRVYSMAEKTLIFLGPADDQSGQLLDVMDRVGSRISKTKTSGYWNFTTLGLAVQGHEQQRATSHLTYKRVIGLLRIRRFHRRLRKVAKLSDLESLANTETHPLMNEPWWTRVWVIQELILSQSPWFIYGRRIVAADHIASVVLFVDIVRDYAQMTTTTGLKIEETNLLDAASRCSEFNLPAIDLYLEKKFSTGGDLGWPLGFVLSAIRRSTYLGTICLHTSQPIDQIYGILGLVTAWPEGQAAILPDYSLSSLDVFAKATIAVSESATSRFFTQLRTATYPKNIPGLPSWTCDWTAESRGAVASYKISGLDKPASSLPYETSHDGKHLLTLHGRSYGSISAIGAKTLLTSAPNLDVTGEVIFTGDVMEDQQRLSREVAAWLCDSFSPFWKIMKGCEATQGVSLDDECAILALLTMERAIKEISMASRAGCDWRDFGILASRAAAWKSLWSDHFEELAQCVRPTLQSLKYGTPASELDESVVTSLLEMPPVKLDLEDTLVVMNDTLFALTQSTVRVGDLVVKFDLDQGVHFIIRPVEADLYQLISMAWVPGLMGDSIAEGEERDFRLC